MFIVSVLINILSSFLHWNGQGSLTEPWKHLRIEEMIKLFYIVKLWTSNTETNHYWFSVCWLCVVLMYHEAPVRTLNICWWSCSILRGTESLKYEFDCLTLYSLKWVSWVGLMERWGLFTLRLSAVILIF